MKRKLIQERKQLLLELNEVELQIAALKLRKLLDQNRFPEWVADSWVDETKKRAIPLKNGFWIRPYSIYTPNDTEPDSIYYSGKMSDQDGKVVGGIVTVNINDKSEIDSNTWKDLVSFSEAFKRAEDSLIHSRVSIDNEIAKLENMLKNGKTSLGRLSSDENEGMA